MKKNTPSTTELEQEISSEYNIREKNVKKKKHKSNNQNKLIARPTE